MKTKVLSQELLKLIACVTMLIDHVGAVLFPGVLWLRCVGRLAFPIYCFLLTEGIVHSRNHKKYVLRLAAGALLAELPFDLLFFGKLTWAHQSVMITLLLGVLMVLWYRKQNHIFLPFAVCFLAAEFLGTDYGGWGIALIALFAATTNLSGGWGIRLAGMTVIFWMMNSASIWIGGIRFPIQLLGVLALIPIQLYSGQKVTRGKTVQWVFYLFYPVHLLVLLLIIRCFL